MSIIKCLNIKNILYTLHYIIILKKGNYLNYPIESNFLKNYSQISTIFKFSFNRFTPVWNRRVPIIKHIATNNRRHHKQA